MSVQSNDQLQVLELDLQEWKRLATLSDRKSVVTAIQEKIVSLERHVEDLASQKPIPTPPSSQSADGTQLQAPEIFSQLSNFAWDQSTENIK